MGSAKNGGVGCSRTAGGPLIAIIGPTASGKSALALALAKRIGGEIVNCDAMQTIRGMNIGTAKPTEQQQAEVAHHLFDVVDPDELYSAGRYMVEARTVCREISERSSVPIVTGGTGLYLRALLDGVFRGPGRSEALRRRLHRIYEERGADFLHRILARKDPVTAARLPEADRIRVVRALEVFFLSGKPISQWQPGREALPGFSVLKIGINLSRELLYARINHRVQVMFERGLVAEVRDLLDRGWAPECRGFEAIGYRSVAACLLGKSEWPEAVERTCRDTRRYAKRQMTWFRKETGIHWFRTPGESPETLFDTIQLVRETFPSLKVQEPHQGLS